MKNDEEKFEDRLRWLKKIEPSPQTLAILKDRVFSRAKEKDKQPATSKRIVIFRTRLVRTVEVLAVVALLVAGTVGRDYLRRQYQKTLVQTQVALSSNGYEKARLTLDLSQSQLGELKTAGDKDLSPRADDLARSVSQADAYITGLKLTGEPGKYSSQQCLETYRAYNSYLGELMQTVQSSMTKTQDQATKAKLQSLLDQTSQYKQNTESKLQQNWPQ